MTGQQTLIKNPKQTTPKKAKDWYIIYFPKAKIIYQGQKSTMMHVIVCLATI